ncbi:serine hydrolase [Mucilaginibacter sp. CSA2-8R]|uniref:serine hydrolase domain-containing protein n=1 Tax=Mucilaginibacter sp. CSA2-8R TaxID=3141542 RepID=UPI00315DB465
MNYRLIRYLFFCWAILCIAVTTSAKPAKNDTLSAAAIDQLISKQLPSVAPGGVVCIARHGQIIYKKAFGKANLKTGLNMTEDMAFRVGSITKQFTAVAILQLVEQGKLSLTDTIQKYVKDFPVTPYPITIENLLTQTSGIINYQAIEHPNPAKVRDNYTPAQGVDYFKDEPLLFKPGTKFDYSNSNYYLLGYIIEQVTGQSYPNYLIEHIIKPAGVIHTNYIGLEQTGNNIVRGYSRFDGKRWENADLQNPTVLYAAGGLVSNADDLVKWHQALLQGKLASRSLLKKAYTPYRLNDGTTSDYGYGWYIRNLDGEPTIEHSGSTDGYQTNEIYLPNQDIYIVTLFNGFEQDMDWIVLSNDIARLACGKPVDLNVKIDENLLKQYAGTYIFNAEHQLIITHKGNRLFVESPNPKDRLWRVQLHAKSSTRFYIKEAKLEFEFSKDETGALNTLTTYNGSKKDADWKKKTLN